MSPRRSFLTAFALLACFGCGGAPEDVAQAPVEQEPYWVYFGTYTRETSKGIYRSRFDAKSGDLSDPELAAEIESPSYLTVHPNERFLYAVSELGENGTVSAFSIDSATGALTKLNTQPSQGGLPCDLEVDSTGSMLVVANYGTGSTSAYKINADGSLSEPTDFEQHEGSSVHERQKGPHAHSVDFTADNKYVMVSDLGIDKVLVYEVDAEAGTLEPANSATLAPGSGPRHFAFHPTANFVFTVNELASTVTSFRFDPGTASMEEVATVSTLPDDFDGNNSTAEIQVHPSGDYLYASNRGHNSLAIISINKETGAIERTGNISTQGETPRNFAIAPGGEYLLAANQNTDNVVVFGIQAQTGAPEATGRQITVDAPVCILYVPAR